jgi:hypothetical protein
MQGLSLDMIKEVLAFLSVTDLARFTSTSKTNRTLWDDEVVWRRVADRDFGCVPLDFASSPLDSVPTRDGEHPRDTYRRLCERLCEKCTLGYSAHLILPHEKYRSMTSADETRSYCWRHWSGKGLEFISSIGCRAYNLNRRKLFDLPFFIHSPCGGVIGREVYLFADVATRHYEMSGLQDRIRKECVFSNENGPWPLEQRLRYKGVGKLIDNPLCDRLLKEDYTIAEILDALQDQIPGMRRRRVRWQGFLLRDGTPVAYP